MGNRAIITSVKRDMALYLHWNGGRSSVDAFLRYCELRGFRKPEEDEYGWARLVQVVANFFDADGLSVGVRPYTDDVSEAESGGDNGLYIIKGWRVVRHVYPIYDENWVATGLRDATEEEEHAGGWYDLHEMLLDIDECQPLDQRLGADFLGAEDVPTADLRAGDWVFVRRLDGRYELRQIVGFGENRALCGRDLSSVPYVDTYGPDNINSYMLGDSYRRIEK